MAELSSTIEHTCLRADATRQDHLQLCEDASVHGFAGVCVLPSRVAMCREQLARHVTRGVAAPKVVTVVGFPLGSALGDQKAQETRALVAAGAQEIDMVWDLGAFKDGDLDRVREDMRAVVEAAGEAPVKVIVETALLGQDEKKRAVALVAAAGAAYIKTSTGFAAAGASVDDVRLFRREAGDALAIKAAGGIRDRATALAMLEAGADRLGTSSGPALLSR